MDNTLDYYNKNADEFVQGTLSVDFKQTQDRFLNKLPDAAYLLDKEFTAQRSLSTDAAYRGA